MISTRKQYIVMMGLCAIIAFINLGTQAKGAVILKVTDDPDPTALETMFNTNIGISFENTSTDKAVVFTHFGAANLSFTNGFYGTFALNSGFDATVAGTFGAADSSFMAELATPFRLDPGEIGFALFQVLPTRGSFVYDRALYPVGSPFNPFVTGEASSFLLLRNSFATGGAFGPVSLGNDEFLSLRSEGHIVSLASTPEPSSVLLGAFGGLLGLARRRR